MRGCTVDRLYRWEVILQMCYANEMFYKREVLQKKGYTDERQATALSLG